MTIDIGCINDNDEKEKILENFLSHMRNQTRETDITGWYAHDTVIGIIFTEVDENDTKSVTNTISNRVKSTIGNVVNSEYLNEIIISLHWFPNGKEKFEINCADQTKIFYPDILDKRKHNHESIPLLVKRGMDIIGSLLGLILFSPFFIIIPILIKISSKGPVLYKQERIGLFGQKFAFLKFRTMLASCSESRHQEYVKNFITNKDDNGIGQNGVYKISDDSRVTAIGRFLRRSSLDELPQFINVLKGEMSLVGPRPPIPYECEYYKIWHMRRVIEVKPGITGLWQVEGRSSCSFNEMVRLDLKYMEDWSLWLDIKILIKTPWVVIKGRGAY
jgi:lipopolysaccharide/colanic/teichoic acid biosynthesis glycosyltransferase